MHWQGFFHFVKRFIFALAFKISFYAKKIVRVAVVYKFRYKKD